MPGAEPPPRDEALEPRSAGARAGAPASTSLPPIPPLPPDLAPRAPVVEPPSPDVTLAAEASPLPGAHRGGFLRLPTAPVAVTTQSAPAEPGTEEDVLTSTAGFLLPEIEQPRRWVSGWALGFAVAGLVMSLFVGWGFPLGIIAIATAIVALRRPLESSAVAVWAIVLGAVSILYSAGWLVLAAYQANILA